MKELQVTGSVRMAAIYLILTVSISMSFAQELSTEAENTLWDPFRAMDVDEWNPNIGPYSRTMSSASVVGLESIRAVFESREDFDKYKSSCSDKPLTKIVKQIATDDDKKAILDRLKNTDEAMDLAFMTVDGVLLIPPVGAALWPLAVTSFIHGALDKTEYVSHINKTRDSLSTLMAVGGKLRYEERPYQATQGERPWKIYRAIIYQVKVGDEERLIPICVQTVQVIVKGSQKPDE